MAARVPGDGAAFRSDNRETSFSRTQIGHADDTLNRCADVKRTDSDAASPRILMLKRIQARLQAGFTNQPCFVFEPKGCRVKRFTLLHGESLNDLLCLSKSSGS